MYKKVFGVIVISSVLEIFNRTVISPTLVLSVLLGGMYFMIKLRAFYFFHPIKVIKGMLSGSKDTGESSFKSVTLALAGTLGVGNIVGVSSAILLGGAGAVFWMWVGAFISMALKYSEILLGVRFRCVRVSKGVVGYYGGAAYYIRQGLSEKGIGGRLPVILGGVFSLFCIINSLTTGTAIQTGAVSDAVENTLGLSSRSVALILIILVTIAILIGKDRFSSLTMVLIPMVSVVYMIMSLYVILINMEEVPRVLEDIISEAFSFRGVGGGMLGSTLARGMRYGISRGIISNEAGCGTAPTAHARANVKTPSQQGFWGIFEVFADTIVLCSMTAVCVLIYRDNIQRFVNDGMTYTLLSYESAMGETAGYVMTACVFVFAYATVLCQYYYGIESLGFISRKNVFVGIYTVLFFVMIFYGAVSPTEEIWQLTDLSVGVMTVINVTVILMLRKTVFSETELYFSDKKAGVRTAHRRK